MTLNSPLASPSATLYKLAQWGITTKKSLGQHFLVDDGVLGRILRLASLKPDDRVLEIGPGIGTLTEALLCRGHQVLALEKDERLLPLLEDVRVRYPHSFRYLHVDALDFVKECYLHIPIEADEVNAFFSAPVKLVANLPYAVAATIVLDYLRFVPTIESLTIMVQKEVADRMAAKPGTKDYGAYSVKLQLIASSPASFQVSRTCFLPAPRVDSTVIRFDRREDQIGSDMMADTYTVIEAAFAERRKTIRNSMRSQFSKQGRDPQLVDALLEASGVSPSLRGEALCPEEYLHLGRLYADMKQL